VISPSLSSASRNPRGGIRPQHRAAPPRRRRPVPRRPQQEIAVADVGNEIPSRSATAPDPTAARVGAAASRSPARSWRHLEGGGTVPAPQAHRLVQASRTPGPPVQDDDRIASRRFRRAGPSRRRVAGGPSRGTTSRRSAEATRPAPGAPLRHRLVAWLAEAGGVAKGSRNAAQIDRLLEDIARRTGDRCDDGALLFQEPVEQARLADVGSPDESDACAFAHSAPALVGAGERLDGRLKARASGRGPPSGMNRTASASSPNSIDASRRAMIPGQTVLQANRPRPKSAPAPGRGPPSPERPCAPRSGRGSPPPVWRRSGRSGRRAG